MALKDAIWRTTYQQTYKILVNCLWDNILNMNWGMKCSYNNWRDILASLKAGDLFTGDFMAVSPLYDEKYGISKLSHYLFLPFGKRWNPLRRSKYLIILHVVSLELQYLWYAHCNHQNCYNIALMTSAILSVVYAHNHNPDHGHNHSHLKYTGIYHVRNYHCSVTFPWSALPTCTLSCI